MKILLVITHGNMGGATKMVENLARELHASGADVSVGFGEGEYLEERLRDDGIPRLRLRHLRRTHDPFAIFSFIGEIKELVDREQFDVVQFNSSNTLSGCLGVKLARRKAATIFTVHGLSMLDKNYRTFPPVKWAYYLFFKFFLLFADATVFVSKNNAREAERMHLGRHRFVIYNGLSADMAFLSREESRNRLKKMTGADLGEAFLVGSIGRLSPEKNYDFLMRVFPNILNKIPSARGVIIGDGPLREKYRQTIAAAGLDGKFFLAGEIGDAAAYVKGFDIFVLPSRYEGLPVTLEECLFAGTPALASDVGGNNEILRPERLYRFDDAGDFMEKFIRLSRGEEPEGSAEDAALKKIFSADHMAAQYLRLFKQGTITDDRAL